MTKTELQNVLAEATQTDKKTVAYPLANFAQIAGDKIRSEQEYLDRRALAEQLGFNPSSASLTTEPTQPIKNK